VTRRFRFVVPGESFQPDVRIITEEAILRDFYPLWADTMRERGRLLMATTENCVDDFVIVHWADELDDDDAGR
jgi:hypothetical protein